MYIWLFSLFHSMYNSPPNKCTFTLFDVLLLRIQATTDAHEPVPHAMVSPEPLSHTLMFIFSLSTISTNSMFDFFGNAFATSKRT